MQIKIAFFTNFTFSAKSTLNKNFQSFYYAARPSFHTHRPIMHYKAHIDHIITEICSEIHTFSCFVKLPAIVPGGAVLELPPPYEQSKREIPKQLLIFKHHATDTTLGKQHAPHRNYYFTVYGT